MRPLRVGVLGAGVISEQYLSTLIAREDIQLVAIASRSNVSAGDRAEAYGIEARTIKELLHDDSIELVLNLTPPSAHLATTLAILEAGKHVWSEKPLAMSSTDAQTIVQAASRRKLLLGVAPDTILGASHRAAVAAIADGSIGVPRSAIAIVQYWGPDAWHPNPEFLFQEGAGPLHDMGPYWLALLVEVFGPVRSVVAEARTARSVRTIAKGPRAGETFAPTVPTFTSALLDFVDGGVATCVFSFEASAKEFSLVVSGDEGAVRFADPNGFSGEVAVIVHGDERSVAIADGSGEGRGLGVVAMARRLRLGEGSFPDAVSGSHMVAVMEAIDEAGRTGVRVEVAGVAVTPMA